MKKDKAKFYVVWNPCKSNPAVTHTSYEEAKREAERIAVEEGGAAIYVLQAVSRSYLSEVRTEGLVV